MYALHGRQLSEAKDTQAAARVIAELKKKLRDRVPSFDEFAALFPEIIYTDNLAKHRKLVRYILVALESTKPSTSTMDFSQLTIEHIVPQSQISKQLPDTIVGQVGNLLLVPEDLNKKLRAKSFQEKKRILKDGGYTLPELIAKAKKWGVREIERRTQALAKTAYDSVWKI